MSDFFTRRHVLQASAAMGAAAVLGVREGRAAGPGFTVLEMKTISVNPEFYHGWPTVCRRKNGELLVSWSGGREAHVCPFGRVEAMTSKDEGKTWTWPRVLLDGSIDDRDSGCLETAKGTLIVTTFTSLAYQSYTLDKQLAMKPGDKARWPQEKLDKWLGVHNRLTEAERQAELGEWCIRSTDGGITWGPRIATVANSPHGPIQLADGRLLYPGKQLWTGDKKIGVAESRDDGVTWRWLAEIPARAGDAVSSYHELHGVEVRGKPGHLVVQIRNHNQNNAGETLQTESADGGKTWTEPHAIGVWGMPSFLLALRDGRLMMTYGHRRKPFGIQARVSSDGAKTWGEAMIVHGEALGTDVGYPSTVELPGGDLLTVWYEGMKEPRGKAVLRQARWVMG